MAGQHGSLSCLPYRGIGSILEEYRDRTPHRAAIIDVECGRSITFAQLAAAVDAIGWRLHQHGMRRGSRIILAGSNGIEKLLLWFAIWRIGAIVCPIDLEFTKPALLSDLTTAINPALVLMPSDAGPLFVAPACRDVLRYGRWRDDDPGEADVLSLLPGSETERLPTEIQASIHDIASVACTSGTTGTPKLVVYDHTSYWLNGLDSTALLALSPEDRLLEYRSFDWFSAQILSLMPFLQLGLTLCVARRFSRAQFLSWVTRHAVSVCVGVPTVINILLEAPLAIERDGLASLRVMSCSSAPLLPLQWQRFEEKYGIRLLNLYGSSEAGWICGNSVVRSRPGTVGAAVSRIGFEIVDVNGTPLPAGQAGQIRVSGAKLAVGLLGSDGRISPIRGAPHYTQDAAVQDADGMIRILGRMDDLIVRGGVKISPQELENVLLEHSAVREAAVLAVPDEIYGQVPASYVVVDQNHRVDVSELLAHCRLKLPHEKMPKYLFIVEALPRNPRGKVRRDLLRRDWWTVTSQQVVQGKPGGETPD
jgi:long-chain acyl-CoA synthetase